MTQKNTYSRVKPCGYRCLLMRLFVFANATSHLCSFDYSHKLMRLFVFFDSISACFIFLSFATLARNSYRGCRLIRNNEDTIGHYKNILVNF